MSQPVNGIVWMQHIGRRLVVTLLAVGGLIGIVNAELAGNPAPDFVLKGVNGQNYRLSEYRGQVVLLSFWASWCGECRSQLEGLAGLYDRYEGAGLEMLAISLDRDRDDVSDAAAQLGVGFPALHDVGGDVGEQYDVNKLPYVILIDRDGTIRDEYTGYRRGQEDEYLQRARELLSE